MTLQNFDRVPSWKQADLHLKYKYWKVLSLDKTINDYNLANENDKANNLDGYSEFLLKVKHGKPTENMVPPISFRKMIFSNEFVNSFFSEASAL